MHQPGHGADCAAVAGHCGVAPVLVDIDVQYITPKAATGEADAAVVAVEGREVGPRRSRRDLVLPASGERPEPSSGCAHAPLLDLGCRRPGKRQRTWISSQVKTLVVGHLIVSVPRPAQCSNSWALPAKSSDHGSSSKHSGSMNLKTAVQMVWHAGSLVPQRFLRIGPGQLRFFGMNRIGMPSAVRVMAVAIGVQLRV